MAKPRVNNPIKPGGKFFKYNEPKAQKPALKKFKSKTIKLGK